MRRALILAGLLLASTARADDSSGQKLLDSCKGALAESTHYFESGYCYGYVMGVWDATVPIETSVCYRRGVKLEQMVRIVVKYLEAHPEVLDDSPFYNVVAAMDEAFPCPKAAKPKPTPRGF